MQRRTVVNRKALAGVKVNAFYVKLSCNEFNFIFLTDKKDENPVDNVVDEFGRISPLDLNLDLDFPVSQSHSYVNMPLSNSVKERVSKESWDKRRVSSQITGSGDRRLARKPSGNQKSDLPGHSSLNDNHNNSSHPHHTSVASVIERKETSMKTSSERKEPPAVAPKPSVLRRRISPQVMCHFFKLR